MKVEFWQQIKMYKPKKWLYFCLLIAAVVTVFILAILRRPSASMQARLQRIVSDIHSGNHCNVEPAIDKLILDFNHDPALAKALWQIGQEYYNKAVRMDREGLQEQAKEYYRKALAPREKIIQQLPLSDLVPKACFTAAVIYSQELEQYKKGIEYYHKVVDNWPDYKYAYHAQYLIGSYYERLKKSKGMAQVGAKIEKAYKTVIEKYPDSSSAPQAARRLGKVYLSKERWTDAAYYFQMFVETDNERTPKHVLLSVLLDLGRTYEEMDEPDMAAETYHTFLQTAQPDHPRAKAIRTKLDKLEGTKK
jgi:tetratricopeptide (TPR) repeat protein